MTASSTFAAADGDGYELQMGRWSQRLAGPFLDFVGTPNGERVLDVGCGTGRLAFALAERCQVRELRGVDFSPAYVEHATRHNHDPKIVFDVGDACALAFPDCSFDRVLSLLSEGHCARLTSRYRQSRRIAMRKSPVVWFEIYVQDMNRAKKFYESVLQGKLEQLGSSGMDMWAFPGDMNAPGAGGALVRMPGLPSGGNSTLVYFGCEDCSVEEGRVVKAGGRIHKNKFSIGQYGFITLAIDTEGNMFGLHSMK